MANERTLFLFPSFERSATFAASRSQSDQGRAALLERERERESKETKGENGSSLLLGKALGEHRSFFLSQWVSLARRLLSSPSLLSSLASFF
jgi:hypothetical protein